ncbi:MAG TPA: hypothetical protein VHW71_13420 [Steroidobacteraceae bacterium]|jgi:hypothetical protein|nr:hypothetical protein [Steroidobacteraceae bacterium]
MSIISFLSKSSFDPEITDILAAAFDTAWERIKLSGSPLAEDEASGATREALARNIIAMAKTGVRDQNRLVEGALANIVLYPGGRGPAAGDTPIP